MVDPTPDDFWRLQQAFRHWVYRNHPHLPRCDGCVDAAAYLALPGYRGERGHPLVR